MKRFIVVSLMLSGCAHGPYLTCEEQCSLSGMKCTGMTLMDSSAGAYHSGHGDSPGTFSTGRASATTMICAKDPQAQAEIQSYREQAQKKIDTPFSAIGVMRRQRGDPE